MKAYTREKRIQQFWKLVNKLPGQDSCWEWTGSISSAGYGQFDLGGKRHNSHRAAYRMFINDCIPEKHVICHRCDNRKCVRPDHLFVGTHKENTHDMLRKGRFRHKLSVQDIDEILAAVNEPPTQLARRFKCTKQYIWQLRNGIARRVDRQLQKAAEKA